MSKGLLTHPTRCYHVLGGGALSGRVRAEGAKNAVLPLMTASLLSDEPVRLDNVPQVEDVKTMVAMLTHAGKKVSADGNAYVISENGPLRQEASYELVRRMRASFNVLGPLAVRLGEARVPLPGGCVLGSRPVDFHLHGLRALGLDVDLREGVVHARAKRLCGASIHLDYPSVGATQHLMMTAALIPEPTTIHNAAQEPEVYELIHLLTQMGARVCATPDRIEVHGDAHLKGASYRVIPDRLNAGTYLIAGAISGGEVVVECIPAHLEALLAKLQEAGAQIACSDGEVRLKALTPLRGVDLVTGTYPGFANDLQPQMMTLLCLAQGDSLVRETVFDDRFGQVPELVRMGASIQVKGDVALIKGGARLEGTEVHATDIRSGAALVLAGLAARGQTRVIDPGHTARGYANLAGQLRRLGAEIEVL